MAERPKKQGEELSTEETEILKHIPISDTYNGAIEQMSLSMPRTEQDYQREIARLEVSTKRYSLQTKALTSQADLLRRLRAEQPTSSSFTARSFSQRALSEAQYSRTYNEETLSTVRTRIETIASSLAALSKSAPLVVAERLKEHDQMISALSTPQQDSSTTATASTTESSHIDLLAKGLIKLRSEALRDRLDRVFLETLQQPSTKAAPSDPSATEINVLETDIQSLYVEIDDVLSMLVAQQCLHPLKSALEQVKSSEERLRNEETANSIRTLQHLTTELTTLEEHVKSTRSSRIFLLHLSKHLQQIDDDVHRTLKRSVSKASAAGTSTAEIATKRFLEHTGATDKPPAVTSSESSTTKGGVADMLNLLSSAAKARTTAITALESTPDSSVATSTQIHELETCIEAARQTLMKHST